MCEKQFAVTSLAAHKKIVHLKEHSGENRCSQRDYASSRASDLRRHMGIHSGGKFEQVPQAS